MTDVLHRWLFATDRGCPMTQISSPAFYAAILLVRCISWFVLRPTTLLEVLMGEGCSVSPAVSQMACIPTGGARPLSFESNFRS